MPIRINLLAESLAEEDSRRRDPVKRAIYIGALLVVLSLVWYSSIWLNHMLANNELNRVKADVQICTTIRVEFLLLAHSSVSLTSKPDRGNCAVSIQK